MKWQWMAALAAVSAPVVAQAQDAPYQREARAMLERIVSFRTAEGQGKVPEAMAWLADTLKAGGVPASDIVMLPSGQTVGMIVRIPGRDAAAKPILFSAHVDVVDARPEDWERDPFKLIEENGYFFGRGSLDNKAGVVSLASTILQLERDKVRPRRTLVFAFVGDEETTFDTTRLIVAHPWVKDSEFAINTDGGGGLLTPAGQPLVYLVQGAEKTYATFTLTVTNPGGHSSRPRPDNAIYDLSRALLKVADYRFPVMANDLTRAYIGAVGKVTPGPAGEMMRRFAANPQDVEAQEALWQSAEFGGTTRTTCIATMLDAGHAENALPQKATGTVNCRIFPEVPIEEVRQTLADLAGDKVQVTLTNGGEASPVSNPTPAIMAAIGRSIHADYPKVEIAPYLESGGTDGVIYRSAGIPTFGTSGVFINPDEMFAHGLNERIPVKSFYEAVDHIHSLAVELGGK